MTSAGPFETAQEARAAAHTIIQPGPDLSILDEHQNRLLLEQVCEAAGVKNGIFDERVLGWLALYEDSLCGSIAGMIRRAREAGERAGPRDGTPTERFGS
jgi:hypothetical protein